MYTLTIEDIRNYLTETLPNKNDIDWIIRSLSNWRYNFELSKVVYHSHKDILTVSWCIPTGIADIGTRIIYEFRFFEYGETGESLYIDDPVTFFSNLFLIDESVVKSNQQISKSIISKLDLPITKYIVLLDIINNFNRDLQSLSIIRIHKPLKDSDTLSAKFLVLPEIECTIQINLIKNTTVVYINDYYYNTIERMLTYLSVRCY